MLRWAWRFPNRVVHGDIILTKAFARHKDVGSTQVYIYTDKEELYGAIDIAFSSVDILFEKMKI